MIFDSLGGAIYSVCHINTLIDPQQLEFHAGEIYE